MSQVMLFGEILDAADRLSLEEQEELLAISTGEWQRLRASD